MDERSDSELLRLYCPGCNKRLKVRPEHVGRKTSCPKCQLKFRVEEKYFRRTQPSKKAVESNLVSPPSPEHSQKKKVRRRPPAFRELQDETPVLPARPVETARAVESRETIANAIPEAGGQKFNWMLIGPLIALGAFICVLAGIGAAALLWRDTPVASSNVTPPREAVPVFESSDVVSTEDSPVLPNVDPAPTKTTTTPAARTAAVLSRLNSQIGYGDTSSWRIRMTGEYPDGFRPTWSGQLNLKVIDTNNGDKLSKGIGDSVTLSAVGLPGQRVIFSRVDTKDYDVVAVVDGLEYPVEVEPLNRGDFRARNFTIGTIGKLNRDFQKVPADPTDDVYPYSRNGKSVWKTVQRGNLNRIVWNSDVAIVPRSGINGRKLAETGSLLLRHWGSFSGIALRKGCTSFVEIDQLIRDKHPNCFDFSGKVPDSSRSGIEKFIGNNLIHVRMRKKGSPRKSLVSLKCFGELWRTDLGRFDSRDRESFAEHSKARAQAVPFALETEYRFNRTIGLVNGSIEAKRLSGRLPFFIEDPMSLIHPQAAAFEQKEWPVLFKGPSFPSLDRSATQIVDLPDEVNHQKGIVKQEVFFADLGDKCKVVRKLAAKSDPQYPKDSDNAKFLNYPITFNHSLSYDINSRHKRIEKIVIIGSAQDGVGFDHSRSVSYEVEMQLVPAIFDDKFVSAPRSALAALDVEQIRTQLASADLKERRIALESMSLVQLEPNNEISSILANNPDRDHWHHENYYNVVESCVMPHDVERFVSRALRDGAGPVEDRHMHVLALLERSGEAEIMLPPDKLEIVFATLIRSGESSIVRETIRVLRTRFPNSAEKLILEYIFKPKQITKVTVPAMQTLAVIGGEDSLRAMEEFEVNFDSAKLPWSRTRGSDETRKLKAETLTQLVRCIKATRERLLTVK